MKLEIIGAPHLRGKTNTASIMRDVLIALLPAIGAAIYFFGLPALFLIGVCTITALATEEAITKIRKQNSTLGDLSALVTGALVALILPPAVNWFGAVIATIFAILVGKHLFGGLGSNIFNPALLGRAFLAAAYPTMITTYVNPGRSQVITEATPLMLQKFNNQLTVLDKLFFGNVPGSLGETSALCLIVGGAYLLLRRSADWRIPASLLATVLLTSTLGYHFSTDFGPPLFHLLAGGLLIGAFFMATDPATTPATKKGKFIFGVACGLLIMVLRYFSNLAEGVLYSILFMNAAVPLINRYTRPKPFGRI